MEFGLVVMDTTIGNNMSRKRERVQYRSKPSMNWRLPRNPEFMQHFQNRSWELINSLGWFKSCAEQWAGTSLMTEYLHRRRRCVFLGSTGQPPKLNFNTYFRICWITVRASV